jgi:hypothetical protein
VGRGADVKLLAADRDLDAMLPERCESGDSLRGAPEGEQDMVIAGRLRRIWRKPSEAHPFRPLSALVSYWSEETKALRKLWLDKGLVQAASGCLKNCRKARPKK